MYVSGGCKNAAVAEVVHILWDRSVGNQHLHCTLAPKAHQRRFFLTGTRSRPFSSAPLPSSPLLLSRPSLCSSFFCSSLLLCPRSNGPDAHVLKGAPFEGVGGIWRIGIYRLRTNIDICTRPSRLFTWLVCILVERVEGGQCAICLTSKMEKEGVKNYMPKCMKKSEYGLSLLWDWSRIKWGAFVRKSEGKKEVDDFTNFV